LNDQQIIADAADIVSRDVMTEHVISVSPEASVKSVAQTLFDHRIGAVPVIDARGVVVGMVSDGDLLGQRTATDRPDWWLDMLAGGKPMTEQTPSVSSIAIRDVMTTPVLTVEVLRPVREIAHLLQAHRIKRMPVMQDGKMVGIVSRSDLLGVVEHLPEATATKGAGINQLYGLLQSLFGGTPHERHGDHAAVVAPAQGVAPPPEISADGFRQLVTASRQDKVEATKVARHAGQLERQRRVKVILEQQVSAAFWQELLDHAQLAAKHGQKEMLLLTFPSELCSDSGRAIDAALEGWQNTLRGEAADIYARWEQDLKPKSFGLNARVVTFENDQVGDFGLYLTWGE
jgi:CBS domain-containing protein